jgi:hypothetical protein
MSRSPTERHIEWAGGLIAAGSIVEIASSFWTHPLAFIAFAVIAGPLVVAGMLLFLWSLV